MFQLAVNNLSRHIRQKRNLILRSYVKGPSFFSYARIRLWLNINLVIDNQIKELTIVLWNCMDILTINIYNYKSYVLKVIRRLQIIIVYAILVCRNFLSRIGETFTFSSSAHVKKYIFIPSQNKLNRYVSNILSTFHK